MLSGEIETRIRSSRWIAVLLSTESLRTNDMMSVWLVSIIKMCIEENQLRIMVLLRDLGPEDIPDFIQWVTYIDIQEEKRHIDRIIEIVQGLIINMFKENISFRFVLFTPCNLKSSE